MCHTSAYFVRCSTCKQDLDHKLVVDAKCKNKIHGRINCSIIYPVNMNVEWVDMTHCLVCYAKRDMLNTRMQATVDADAQEAIDNPTKSDSTDIMIGNQLQNDIDSVIEMEKPERIANWLQGHPDLLLDEAGQSLRGMRHVPLSSASDDMRLVIKNHKFAGAVSRTH
ncbi:hypothetical protein HG531_004568 [Fusarium graminearum]|nr:hypothetical protein HG531_004568 [Fusarium graminearum]